MTKTLLLWTNLMLSTLFLFSVHPMIMGSIILIQTSMICFLMNLIHSPSWISFIIFLLFMGGLLILFLYIISMAPNEINQLNYLNLKKMIPAAFLLYASLNSWLMNNSQEPLNSPINQMKMEETLLFMKLFNSNSSMITIFMMMILFMMLCITVILVSSEEGPLRITK